MCEATDAIERREEEYLHKIADRYALPEKKAPPSPVPGYIRALLQQIALGVMVLMIAALVTVYRVHVSDTKDHITQDLVYAVVGCISAVFIVNALGWVALSWHNRAGVCCFAFFMLVLCVLSGFAIDQLVTLQFTQRNLQDALTENRRNFTEEDVEQLVNGGLAPSLLHRFILDGPTYFLRWLQPHCSFAANVQTTHGGSSNSTGDGSAHTDQMIDSLDFYTGFWRPREQECVKSALSIYRKIGAATQLALTALLVVMGVQLVLSGTLFLLEEAEFVGDSDQVSVKGKRSKKKKKGARSRSQRRHQQQPYLSVLRLLSFAIAVSGLITCALSADLLVSCDFSMATVRYILIGIFSSGVAGIVASFLISCCHWERTSFIKWLLVLLAIANIYAVANCMTLQEVLRGEKTDASISKDVILQDAYDLVSNQTCATVTTWRAHTCEHKKPRIALPGNNNSSNIAIVVGDVEFDSVCQDELASLLLATLRPGIAWLAGLVALNCLSLLILLAPAFQNFSSALARSFCNCLCFPGSSSSSPAIAAAEPSEKVQLKHASLVLEVARELYLSTIRIKDEAFLEAETAAFNDEWALMTGCNAADTTSATIIYQNEFDAIVRSLVIRRLTTHCKMDVSLSVSKDVKQLFVKIHASDNLLMTALCDMEYTLELAEFVDPGPLFWRNKREIKNDLKVLDPHTIKQKLKLLAANNVITKKEAERFPNESHSRVSARIHALMRAARISNGSLKCRNPHLPFAQYVPHTEFQYLFKKHPNQLEIPGNVRRSSVLRTIDNLRITRHLIEAELNVNQMVENGLLTSFHCLHSASRFDFNSKAKLASSWVFFWRPRHLPGEFEPETHWFLNQFGRLNPFRQPLRDIRDYFGECIAFYFAWLAFYAQLLMLPAVAVIVMALYQPDNPEFMISWSFYRTGHAPSTQFTISRMSFALGLGVILWGILFAKFWERKSVWYQLEWGTTHLDLDLQDRTGFWGVMRRNPVTNEVEIYFNGRRRMLRQLSSMILILGLGAANLLLVVALILSQGYFAQWGLSLRLVVLLSSSCQAFLIQWNGDFISVVAHKLSEFENYQNDAAFQVSVVAKVFVLQLLNTYSGLLVLAFADLLWLKHTPLFSSLYKVYETQIVPEMNVLVQLETLLLLIFVVRITSHLLGILHSYSLGKLALANLAHAQQTPSGSTIQTANSIPDGTTNRSNVEDENALEPYRGAYEDYTEIVVQFGLVVMFSSVFPLAPLLAFVECVLEMRLDALDLCLFFQRPVPEAAADIGPWAACIQILLKLALTTLFGLVYFTADNHSELSLVQRASAFLIATLTCWLLSEILWLVLPSTSTQAQEVQARNEFLVERYFGVDNNSSSDAGEHGDAFGAGRDFDGNKKAAEFVASIETSTVDDKVKAAQSKLEDDSSVEHYRERIELLQRLNIAMRRREELLPTDEVGIPTAEVTAAPVIRTSSSLHAEGPPVDEEHIIIDDDEEEEQEKMIVGYFRPVRTLGVPASPNNDDQQQQQPHSDAVPLTLSDPNAEASSAKDVALGIPIAQDVRESSASVSSIAPPPIAADAFSSDRRPSKRASFFARLSKRDSPRASFSSSSSSRNRRSSSDSSEGLPPFSFASRRVSKLSPALLAAALELGVSDVTTSQPPPASAVVAPTAAPTAAAVGESQAAASDITAASSAPPPRLSISIPRQYTDKELAGMDAINEATRRSRFDFYAEDGKRTSLTMTCKGRVQHSH